RRSDGGRGSTWARADADRVRLTAVTRARGADREQEAIQRLLRLIGGGEDHNKCGMWNAECGMAVLSSGRGASHTLDAGKPIPHSALRIPHSAMQFSYLLSQLGNDFKQVSHNSVIRHLEDRCIL